MEKVSIILPIYNVEEYLAECLDSILRQTYKNLEIILVDDGSPDASGAICDEYQKKDDRIKVIHKKNGGVGAARNTGIERANGDYITFADPDDWLEIDMIEKMVTALKQRHADISYCRFKTDIIAEEKRHMYQPIKEHTGDGKDAVCQMLKSLAYGTMVWNKMFCRNMIYNKDGSYIKFHESLKCGEDEVWLAEVVRKAQCVAYLQEELYYWRVRENSAYRDECITDTKIMDIVAQEMTLKLIEDDKSEAYIRVMERLNEKTYQYRLSAYIKNQKDYVKKLTVFNKKYGHYWYESDRVAFKTKFKRKIIDICIDININRKLVEKLAAM